ncbi:PhzF family phenazine biosynthesis protein [Lysobacter solisilvae (ex Woo and Kim 2020)]|uniref:PhzF family phenazine biosynthesis isomerase n=1 Tax=Agrilutibacter terrestris TaxID=2865112 RepID=A0A7H0FZ49_9GAMM|nr:PhzF family phenazine biosynthesis isomerase [Lysobacter terrestris]QNP41315.1 PhzF family phenazine biosynthesis isomerase [Lysobacter terrestris]
MSEPELLRYTAFTDRPEGGNPAGVVLDARGLDAARMQAIAAAIGYSETAFLSPRADGGYDTRYYSPEKEISFCGHATIAAAVALAERSAPGHLRLHTRVGEVAVETHRTDGRTTATLTSVEPHVVVPSDELLASALAALRWSPDELDPALPARIGFAGARHLILAARTRERLRELDYDYAALKALMLAHDLTTLALLWREGPTLFHARNPFPPGGVVEDPATGAAAAALGAYLRELALVVPPATITIHQGVDMGRPSLLTVEIGARGGIRVTGQAVPVAP